VRRREFLKSLGWGAAGVAACGAVRAVAGPKRSRPNFVIIFTDDQGYNDVGCFGSKQIRTPRLDRMAAEGRKFTSFYAQTVCGPSRAALMTGCYPLRVAKKDNRVDIHPYLHSREVTIAEVLKAVGYATACFGKWDLAGHRQRGYAPELLPTRQGFDNFFGTPTSNDSVVNLLRNEEVIERKADMNTLTRRYTDEAVAFIRKNRQKPFFVYLPHTMPHTRLGASAKFRGRSKRGLYGDVIEEIDWNVGRILDTIRELGLDEKTYVIFTSDNGPWSIKKSHGGSAKPLRGAKTSTWEGGLRVPCIVRAPGRVPPGSVCDEIASTMDLLPTLANLAGAKVPDDRVIDGRDITALLHGHKGATSPTKAFFYYQHTHLQAVRSGRWKLHLPRPARPPWAPPWARHIKPEDVIEIPKPMLFDLAADVGERHDVAEKHPDVVRRLLALAEKAREDIGDYDRIGKNARFFDPAPKRPDIGRWKMRPSRPRASKPPR
jgi:arylsulfatase